MSSQPQSMSISSALRTPGEENLCALTHGVGLVLSVGGGAALVVRATHVSDLCTTLACVFYVVTLAAVYAASMLSHMYFPPRLNRFFRSLDQGCIYLLIVGTYTPFALTHLRTPGWIVFYIALLAVAGTGFASKLFFRHRLQGVCVWLYVGLGWSQAVSMWPLGMTLPLAETAWIVAGGLCYTLGTIFLVWDLRRYRFHEIWHLMVMAGSLCHFIAVWQTIQ